MKQHDNYKLLPATGERFVVPSGTVQADLDLQPNKDV